MWPKFLLLAAVLHLTWFYAEIQAKHLDMQPISANEVRRLLRVAKREDLISKDRVITKGIIERSLNVTLARNNENDSSDNEIRKLCFFSKIQRNDKPHRAIQRTQLGRSAEGTIACKPEKLKNTTTKLKLPWSDNTATNTGMGKSNDVTSSSSDESDYDNDYDYDYDNVDTTGTSNDEDLNGDDYDYNADEPEGTNSIDDDADTTYREVPYTNRNTYKKRGHAENQLVPSVTTATSADSSVSWQPAATTTWNLTPDTGTSTTFVSYGSGQPSLIGLNVNDNALLASTGTATEPDVAENVADIKNDYMKDEEQVHKEDEMELIHCISFEGNAKCKRSLNKFKK